MAPSPGEPGGEPRPQSELFRQVYAELRRIAGGYFQKIPHGETLQPTALVHEVYLKLSREGDVPREREHFLAVAATAMRQILVDHERARRAQKRGGEATRITITANLNLERPSIEEIDLLALHEALAALGELSERQARVVEMPYFGGLTVDEAAGVLGVSASLVEKEWRRARAWLRRELAATR